MSKRILNKGDIVDIYYDPYTEQKHEGRAIIHKIVAEDSDEFTVDVKFCANKNIEDGGPIYRRFISVYPSQNDH